MDTLQVPAKVVKFKPPTWEGVQIVNGVEGKSYQVGLDLIPAAGVYPNITPKLSASTAGSNGKYNTTPTFGNQPVTTTLVPVLVTVTDADGGDLPPDLTITVDLVYS